MPTENPAATKVIVHCPTITCSPSGICPEIVPPPGCPLKTTTCKNCLDATPAPDVKNAREVNIVPDCVTVTCTPDGICPEVPAKRDGDNVGCTTTTVAKRQASTTPTASTSVTSVGTTFISGSYNLASVTRSQRRVVNDTIYDKREESVVGGAKEDVNLWARMAAALAEAEVELTRSVLSTGRDVAWTTTEDSPVVAKRTEEKEDSFWAKRLEELFVAAHSLMAKRIEEVAAAANSLWAKRTDEKDENLWAKRVDEKEDSLWAKRADEKENSLWAKRQQTGELTTEEVEAINAAEFAAEGWRH
jgi:hypothetical protein